MPSRILKVTMLVPDCFAAALAAITTPGYGYVSLA
jgi:hypothetical protein